MRRIFRKLSKIWLPALVVSAVAAHGLAADLNRAGDAGLFSHCEASPEQDTVIYQNNIYTKFRSEFDRVVDTLGGDSLFVDSAEVVLTARDTMKVPDSLRLTDPFRYKYYA